MTLTPEQQALIVSVGAVIVSEAIGMSKLKSNSIVQLVFAILKKVFGK